MCDYSLQHVASRPAVVGDKLVTSKFTNTFSKGFAEAGSPEFADKAICVLPGTEIAFSDNIRCFEAQPFSWNEGAEKTLEHRVGIFRQINTQDQYTHHDALELPDGTHVTLHSLVAGQSATVLQLPAAPKTAEEAKAQERIAVTA